MLNPKKTQEALLPRDKKLMFALPPQVVLFKGQIILNPTISKINFAAYMLFSTYLGAVIIPVNLLALPLLKVVYGLPQNEQVNITTIYQIANLVLKLLTASLIGYLCDKYGRRIFVMAGIACLCCAVAIMPNLPSPYPYYILAQLTLEMGLVFMNSAPLLADYVDYETKGRVAGLAAVISYITSSVSTFITEGIDLQHGIPSKFHEIAIGALVIGIFVGLGLKGGAYHKRLFYDKKIEEAKKIAPEIAEQEEDKSGVKVYPKDLSGDEERESTNYIHGNSYLNHENGRIVAVSNQINLNNSMHEEDGREDQSLEARELEKRIKNHKPGLIAGLKEAKRNPWILVGYICSFLFYSQVQLVNTCLVNYMTQIVGKEAGASQAFALTNKHNIVAAVMSLFFGFFSDRYNKFKLIMIVHTSSVLAVLLVLVSPTPYNAVAYIAMVMFGISCSGFTIFNNQLISKYPDPRYRASVAAIAGMCSVLGIASTNIVGMFLSKFDAGIPFYIYLACGGIGFVALISLYFAKRNVFDKI